MSNTNFCCLSCRRTYRRPSLSTDRVYRCAHCAKPLTHAGMDFRAPVSTDVRGWKAVEKFLHSGGVYHRGLVTVIVLTRSSGRRTKKALIPKTSIFQKPKRKRL